MDKYIFPIVLKKLLQNKKMSQERFAEVINLSTRTVSNWVREISYPNIHDLIIIADYFSLSIPALVFGEGIEDLLNA